jgi:hypothetical protein
VNPASVFAAAFGIGLGGAIAQWFCVQMAAQLNGAFRVFWDRKMRERVTFKVFCPNCAGECATVYHCKTPACGHVMVPDDMPGPRMVP